MSRLTLKTVRRWPENEYEGSVTFELHGQELEARVVLGEDEWAAWVPGSVVEGEVFLHRWGASERRIAPPGLTRTGTAAYTAAGRVLAVTDEHVVLDVGFPLPVRLDPEPAAEGDRLVVHGELELAPA